MSENKGYHNGLDYHMVEQPEAEAHVVVFKAGDVDRRPIAVFYPTITDAGRSSCAALANALAFITSECGAAASGWPVD